MILDDHRLFLSNHLRKKFPNASLEDIEDVVQDSMIKAFKHLDKFKANSSLRTWLSKIAVNTFYDMFRRSYVKHELLLSNEEGQFIFENLNEDDFSETICKNQYHNELCTKLLSGYEHDIHVQAFLLFSLNDNTYKEISSIQNIPIGTVKSRIFRGKKILLERYTQISFAN